MKTFTIGTLAFFDSFSGLIPCKVISIHDRPGVPEDLKGNTSDCKISVRLTSRRGAYHKGEIIDSDALNIVPRPFVRGNRILGGYRWTA